MLVDNLNQTRTIVEIALITVPSIFYILQMFKVYKTIKG